MRHLITPLLTGLSLIALLWSATALADVPPPAGYVEQCTVAKQEARGMTCQSCSAWHGDVDACDKEFAGQKHRRICRTRGASTWSEVWCTGEPAAPEEEKKAMCSISGLNDPRTPSLLTGVMALLALAAGTLLLRRDPS